METQSKHEQGLRRQLAAFAQFTDRSLGEADLDSFRDLCDMFRSLLPPGIMLTQRCSGWIQGDCVESLTLIANELVTNAAKYAFGGREQGEIILGYREQGAAWSMWVADNGAGIPHQPQVAAAGFGQQLIETLAARISAQLSYSTTEAGGTRVEIFAGLTAS
jgi:nitrate/nitrite-specific signal transduction histidine kinase